MLSFSKIKKYLNKESDKIYLFDFVNTDFMKDYEKDSEILS